ncbi:MAG: ATP-binding protein, partial [Bacteroidota bacterium]
MAKKNSEGLVRQDAFIKSMENQDFDFGLVMTQAFLKGIRDIGYKSTATALFEDFDNSIQAGAENIHLLFDFDKGKSGKSNPDRIAIID